MQPPWILEKSRTASLNNFDQYVTGLAEDVDAATNLVAWSLGGLTAIRFASLFPSLVSKIVFIASTPCFIDKETNIGIDYSWFQQFVHEFDQNPRAVLKKFLALQSKGDEFSKVTLKRLREYSCIEEFKIDECRHGLNLLSQLDLSIELGQLECPKIFIHGEGDVILPIQAGQHAAKLANAELVSIPLAGHAPHVSHPDQINDLLLNYLE